MTSRLPWHRDGVSRRYPVRVGPLLRILYTAIGCPPRWDYIEVTPYQVFVRFGWYFRAEFDRDAILQVKRCPDMWTGGWGPHASISEGG